MYTDAYFQIFIAMIFSYSRINIFSRKFAFPFLNPKCHPYTRLSDYSLLHDFKLFASSCVKKCLITSLQAVVCTTAGLISRQLQHADVGSGV